MNLAEEITKHLVWIDDIVKLLGKPEITPDDIDAVSHHDRCALGKWLESHEAEALRDKAEFVQLVESHSHFHHLAGELIEAARLGDEDAAMTKQAEFIATSQAVVGHLQQLQAQQASA